jgi:hypothetical protein
VCLHEVLPDQIRENELGPEGRKCHLENLGIDGKILLKMVLYEVGCGDMDWIDVAEDRDR